jgi:HSP20 family protein
MNRDLMVFDNLFRDVFDVASSVNKEDKRLYADWDTNDDGYIVKVEIPGIDEENIDVNFENSILTIKAEYKEENENSLRSGKYKWSAKVIDVDIENIDAKLEKGVLIINLPKSEKAKPKRIQISKK